MGKNTTGRRRLARVRRTIAFTASGATATLLLTLTPTTGAGASVIQHRWIIAESALTRIRALDPGLAKAYFDSPTTLVLGAPPKGWSGIRTQSFTSEATFAAVLKAGELSVGVRAVMYDNESWSLTPLAEQRDPASYELAFAKLAHQHGLLAVMSPAIDLVRNLHCKGSTAQAQYLSCGLAASAAKAGDVVDIQAQRLESNPSMYGAFVTTAAGQARAAHRGVVVLAGLSTGTPAMPVTSAQILASARATNTSVNGWWLNVPVASPKCPTCGAANPAGALQFLSLAKTSGL